MDNQSLKLSFVNVRGLKCPKTKTKMQAICQKFNQENQDIVCLLDTHLDEESEGRLKKSWKGDTLFSHNQNSNNSGGIALLSRNIKFSKFQTDINGRYLLLNLNFMNSKLCVAVAYAPADSAKSRSLFFKQLLTAISNFKGKDDKLILLGDFNCVEFPSQDRSYTGISPDNSFKALSDTLVKYNLIDLWRKRNPTTMEFTFFAEGSDRASRIDRVYVPSDINTSFSKVEIKPFAFSDHSELSFEFAANPHVNTKDNPADSWIFNATLLEDQTYVHKITEFWHSWQCRKANFKSLSEWWDKGKERIKTLTRSFSHKKSKIQNGILKSLHKQLRNAQNQGKNPLINSIKRKISKIEQDNAKTHFLNLRLDWVESGEQCTKTFLNLHTSRKAETFVNSIKDPKGKVHTDTSEILNVFSQFYKDLYTQHFINEVDQEILLDDLTMQTLSEIEKEETAEPITLEDLKEAVFKLSNGKSPGSDGLTAEFYKGFWDLLGQDLYDVTVSSFEEYLLPLSQRIATIKCLPKKGDIIEVKNWRPISLLNVDYKILAKALSLRLLNFLPKVISEEQTCSIKGRKISFNLSMLRDLCKIAESRDLDASFISLDQMKAFDRVSWSFLYKTLRKMNFSEYFISYVQLLYTNIFSTIKINGKFSLRFLIERGVRQGCPLSALLYVIISQVLTCLVNENPDIKGIEVNGHEIKLSQYADDTTSILQGDTSMLNFFETVKLFERVSGALVNPDKTNALWLGTNVGRKDKPFGLKWTDKSIKILGVPIGNSPDCITDMWSDKISSMKRSLRPWFHSNLSLKGRVIVVKQLLLPKITYFAFIYPPSAANISEINKIIEDFLWDHKNPKIPTCILELPVNKGGLGLPNLTNFVHSLSLVWVRDIFVNPQTHWVSCLYHFTNMYRNLFLFDGIFKIQLSSRIILNANLPFWYKFLLNSWFKFTKNQRPAEVDHYHLRREPLFLNPLLKGTNRLIPLWFANFKNHPLSVGALYFDWVPTPMTLEQFNDYHDLSLTPHQFHSLKQAVPPSWHKAIVDGSADEAELKSLLKVFKSDAKGKSPTCISNFSCKTFYNELSSESFHNVQKSFQTRKTPFYLEHQNSLGHISWSKIFTNLWANHLDRKTIDVIYRYIHSGIWTREKALNAKLAEHRLCTRCYASTEDHGHIFSKCGYSVEIWQIVFKFLILICPSLKLSDSPRYILAGFSDLNQCNDDILQALEDIRLAYFKTVWKQRNMSLFEHKYLSGPNLLRQNITSYFQLRYDMARKNGKLPSFEPYLKVAKIKQNSVILRY